MEVWMLLVMLVLYSWLCYRIGRWAERRSTRDEPATDKQRAFVSELARELGMDETPSVSTQAQASLTIDHLLKTRDKRQGRP